MSNETELTRFMAREESGADVGSMYVALDGVGCPPLVVRDQHGTTWALVQRGTHVRVSVYQRVRCAEGRLAVRR